MGKALAFVLLFVLTNASVVLLFPPTTPRVLAFLVIFGFGNAILFAVLIVPGIGWLVVGQTSLPREQGRCVALTFDDGPTPEVTRKVLDVLRAKGVRATFFFVGRQVETNPDLARLVRNEGHVIGNHTYSHPLLFCFLTPGQLRRELTRGQDAIRQATGVTPRLFRSPVGLRHPLLASALVRMGLDFVLWSVRTYDTRSPGVESLRQRILDHVHPGAIVLLHDRRGRGASAMLEALPDVIDQLRARGYRLVTV
jgi:peptidoglycan/xylan/chitin deacetylase (PgdA/CDA1 family)